MKRPVLLSMSFVLALPVFAVQPDWAPTSVTPAAVTDQARRPKPTPTPKPAPRPVVTPQQQLYTILGVTAIFIQGNGRTKYADGFREAARSADRHGLVPAEYWTQEMETLFNSIPLASTLPGFVSENPVPPVQGAAPAQPAVDPKLATFESRLMASLIKYATHLSTGRVDPRAVGGDVRVSRNALSIEAIAGALKNTNVSLRESLDGMAPRWPQYRRLQDTLVRFAAAANSGQWPALKAPTKNLKIGETDVNITPLKVRLKTLGYSVADTDAVYSENLKTAVRQYLVDHNLSGDGDVGSKSAIWSHISATADARLQQIRLTMEKMRWLPSAPDARHVFVNLAFQQMTVWEDYQRVMSMKTINGRSKRPTPTLRDRIPIVELNPSWTVPPRIVMIDKLPQIQADPDYLRKNNYVLLDKDMKEVSNWWGSWNDIDMANTDSYYLRQLPGTGNALGLMKFHLTNGFAIYLHDTNEKNLFANRNRMLSSGCVRLERPEDFARYLLRDMPKYNDPNYLKETLATTRLAGRNVPHMFKITLPQAIPTYLMFLTAQVDDNNRIQFAADTYLQDIRLFELLTQGQVRTRTPADVENDELKRRQSEARNGGSDNGGFNPRYPGESDRDYRRRMRREERDRERQQRERERDRDRRGNSNCSFFWC